MSDLIAVSYPSAEAAQSALRQLHGLEKQMLIQLDDAVVVERRADGKMKIHQTNGAVGAASLGGAAWGGLIGLLFLAPLLGMALGAGAGALAGSTADLGVDDNFVRSLGTELEPGNAALVLLVRSMTEDKVLQQMHGQHGGKLLKTSLSTEEETRLREAAAAARAPMAVG
ncbi:DUF1269 domain-containing protein [Pilimelia columellifera]|uniref:DUF1269 domain-containing protein n=1 Tax=Pilimelia columellifera subsp. columellifera TaxID=706583 RepID=A0ABP6AX63_9ACTN